MQAINDCPEFRIPLSVARQALESPDQPKELAFDRICNLGEADGQKGKGSDAINIEAFRSQGIALACAKLNQNPSNLWV